MSGDRDWRPNQITTVEQLIEKRLEYGYCRYIGGELYKKCDCCKVFKPMSEEGFAPDAKRLDGLEFKCRSCTVKPARYLERRHGRDGRFEARV